MPRESTGNMVQDLMSQSPEVAQLVDALSEQRELDPAHHHARIAIIGGPGAGADELAQAMIDRIRESRLDGVIVLDSHAAIAVDHKIRSELIRDEILLDELQFGIKSPLATVAFPKLAKVKPSRQTTQADFDARAKAQQKRERKAVKLKR